MKQNISQRAKTLAYLGFSALIVLLPLHLRIVLMPRLFQHIYVDFTGFFLFASDVALIATLVCWGTSVLFSPRPIQWGPAFISVPLGGITLIGAISAITSVDVDLSLYHTIRLILLDGLYLFVINEIHSLSQVVLPVAIQILLESFVGIGQFLQQHSMGLQQIGELELDPLARGISVVWSGPSLLLRAYGLTDHPNILGGCLAFALALFVFTYLQSSSRWRGVIAITFVLGAVTLVLTFSRSAWLALVGGMAVILGLLFRIKQKDAMKDLAVLLLAVLLVVFPLGWQYSDYLGTRLNINAPSMLSGENRSVVERNALSDFANKMFADHLITGAGIGTFPSALSVAQPNYQFDYQPPQSVLLDVAAETGILGFGFYLALMVSPWIALWLKRKQFETNTKSFALIIATGIVFAATLVGFFDYYTWLLAPGRLWQWVTWGLWGSAYQSWIARTE